MRADAARILHRLFLLGVALKGIDGLLEFTGGVALFLVRRATTSRLLLLLVRKELAEDPKDIIAHYVVRVAEHFSVEIKLFASIYLVGHGLIKCVLAASLLRERRWAFPLALGTLLAFIGYQAYRLSQKWSLLLAAFTGFCGNAARQ